MSAAPAGDRFNAEVRIRRSDEKSQFVVVTCFKLSPSLAEQAGERWIDLHSNEEELNRMGALYRRGRVWWVKYYVDGRPVRESTGIAGDTETVAAISYRFGWRARSEILPLERRHPDLEHGTLTLDPGMTKNDDARKVYLTPQLKAALTEQLARVDALQRELAKRSGVARIIPYLFPRLTGKRAGTPRRAFYKAWRRPAAKQACPGC